MIETHQDALVGTAKVGTNTVKMILIDNYSSVDILYQHTLSKMDMGDRKLENINMPLYGFTGKKVKVVGIIDLTVLFDTVSCQMWKVIKFHVVSASSSYYVILQLNASAHVVTSSRINRSHRD